MVLNQGKVRGSHGLVCRVHTWFLWMMYISKAHKARGRGASRTCSWPTEWKKLTREREIFGNTRVSEVSH